MAATRPADLSFLETAPHRKTLTFSLTASPAEVFAALASDPAGWGEWFPGFSRDGHYVTPAPHGVGSRREVRVGRTTLVETVLAWEEGRRWAFTISEGGLPGVRSLAEDYVVEPEGTGSRLTWTLASETSPHLAGKVTGALTGLIGRRAFGKLDQVLAARRG
jgi:carbon monoxide dehydrogenase subunit G